MLAKSGDLSVIETLQRRGAAMVRAWTIGMALVLALTAPAAAQKVTVDQALTQLHGLC